MSIVFLIAAISFWKLNNDLAAGLIGFARILAFIDAIILLKWVF